MGTNCPKCHTSMFREKRLGKRRNYEKVAVCLGCGRIRPLEEIAAAPVPVKRKRGRPRKVRRNDKNMSKL